MHQELSTRDASLRKIIHFSKEIKSGSPPANGEGKLVLFAGEERGLLRKGTCKSFARKRRVRIGGGTPGYIRCPGRGESPLLSHKKAEFGKISHVSEKRPRRGKKKNPCLSNLAGRWGEAPARKRDKAQGHNRDGSCLYRGRVEAVNGSEKNQSRARKEEGVVNWG